MTRSEQNSRRRCIFRSLSFWQPPADRRMQRQYWQGAVGSRQEMCGSRNVASASFRWSEPGVQSGRKTNRLVIISVCVVHYNFKVCWILVCSSKLYQTNCTSHWLLLNKQWWTSILGRNRFWNQFQVLPRNRFQIRLTNRLCYVHCAVRALTAVARKYFCNIDFSRVWSTASLNCFLYYNSRLLLCITLIFTANDEQKFASTTNITQ